jgi:hypothetical protein
MIDESVVVVEEEVVATIIAREDTEVSNFCLLGKTSSPC